MIANEYQYNLSKAQAARFRSTLEGLDKASPTAKLPVHPLLARAERDALQSQLQTLESEIAEYESLRAGAKRRFRGDNLEELPNMLVQARIARGLTQKQLANLLSIKEQQIQRYEATGYASASFRRVREVASALGLSVREEAALE